MAFMGSPHFQTPLSLYASFLTRLKAIRRARELKRRREERRREFLRHKAEVERVNYENNNHRENKHEDARDYIGP